jgi:hypothetical protein
MNAEVLEAMAMVLAASVAFAVVYRLTLWVMT